MTPDERKLRQESDRGAQAEALLSNPLFQEAFRECERVYLDKWINAPVRDTQGHHELLLLVKNLRAVHQHIVRVATTGKMATIQIQRGKK
jgi:hypothetical protein